MQTHVTFRQIDPSDALREHAAAALGKLTRVYDRIEAAHVTLSGEGPQRKAEVRLVVPGPDVFCTEQRASTEAALDAVVESVRRALVRHKEQRRITDPERTVW